MLRRLIRAGFPAVILALSTGCAPGIDSFGTVTNRGSDIEWLFNVTNVLGLGVFLLVAVLTTIALLRFRERPGEGEPAQVHGNRWLEVTWTIIPVILLAGLFLLAFGTAGAVDRREPSPLRVQVIGHQWWWEFRYPDLNIVTANVLHLPVGRPIELEVTAADVIHSFWVPKIGWKTDAIPNKTNTMRMRLTEAGRWEGACTEYCGTQHAWMRITVVGEDGATFDAWARQAAQPAPTPAEANRQRGQQLFLQSTCVNCHTIQGTDAKGTVGPDLTHLGSRQTLGAGVIANTPENLGRWINHVQQVKPGALMPEYSFSDADLKALVDYLEGLK